MVNTYGFVTATNPAPTRLRVMFVRTLPACGILLCSYGSLEFITHACNINTARHVLC